MKDNKGNKKVKGKIEVITFERHRINHTKSAVSLSNLKYTLSAVLLVAFTNTQ